ncbi:membrane traffic protein [Lithospermum erythrorhizon]|uniref:Membrane traffic protein n=1 Tax=Lithospermum erythrorhizon TaxID=34254 RepID=A0AAV3RMY5_LITER
MDGEVKFTNKATEEVEISKTDEPPNAFRGTDENPADDEVKQPSVPKVSVDSDSRYTEQKGAPPFTEPFGFKVTDESSETYFRGSFSVEELSNDQDKDLQPSGDADYIKVSDAKIKQWSQGRKGNIRSLLSTLQLVLWPESGWKPVPLMNIIEGSGVKRAYQRALLCLHPDKLQQKGAAPHQKYIAEKVFDILQEAWDHFNSIGAI